MNNKMKQCKACGTELYKGAKICPKCGKKQGGKGKFIVIGVIVVLLIIIIAGSGDDTGSTPTATDNGKAVEQITYTSYNLGDMFDELESNAMVAEETYKNAYVEVSGKLAIIDSSGSYISIEPNNGEFYLIGMSCNFKNDEQRDVVKKKSVGDIVTVRGQVTSVGEVLGYSLNIDSIE